MRPTAEQQAARDRIAAGFAAAGFALPGTLIVRAYECGKPRCRCHASPAARHGPYAEWTRKIGGKTITRRLTAQQLTAWQPPFDNARKLRALLAELQELTLEVLEGSENPEP
jgi:hypothetical protein